MSNNNYIGSGGSGQAPIITSKKIESLKNEILDLIYAEKASNAQFKDSVRENINQVLQKINILDGLTKE